VYHGFVRAPGGTFTTFDVPGAGTAANQGTFPSGINDAGAVTGNYTDADNVNHGFVRDANGNSFTVFDAPGAGAAANQGTFPNLNNARGAISGFFIDTNSVYRGFVRR
jgi:hypothetical protein